MREPKRYERQDDEDENQDDEEPEAARRRRAIGGHGGVVQCVSATGDAVDVDVLSDAMAVVSATAGGDAG